MTIVLIYVMAATSRAKPIKTTDYLRSEIDNVKELLSILERIE